MVDDARGSVQSGDPQLVALAGLVVGEDVDADVHGRWVTRFGAANLADGNDAHVQQPVAVRGPQSHVIHSRVEAQRDLRVALDQTFDPVAEPVALSGSGRRYLSRQDHPLAAVRVAGQQDHRLVPARWAVFLRVVVLDRVNVEMAVALPFIGINSEKRLDPRGVTGDHLRFVGSGQRSGCGIEQTHPQRQCLAPASLALLTICSTISPLRWCARKYQYCVRDIGLVSQSETVAVRPRPSHRLLEHRPKLRVRQLPRALSDPSQQRGGDVQQQPVEHTVIALAAAARLGRATKAPTRKRVPTKADNTQPPSTAPTSTSSTAHPSPTAHS